MAELIFYRVKNSLEWPNEDQIWNAITGSLGMGSLPPGSYRLAREEMTPYDDQFVPEMLDGNGLGFYLPFYPEFERGHAFKDSAVGIHCGISLPIDSGCIALTANDASKFYYAMELKSAMPIMRLQVV